MNFKRIKILLVSVLLFMLCFWLLPLSMHADSRAITVLGNLSHQSGKLGAYRALIIGINDYQDAKIGGSETSKSDRDGTYIAYTTGVVYDKNTGLEWFAGPDRNTNWNDAKAWVESLNVGGGWRMPTRTELEALYQEGAGTRNMTPLLNTNGWWVWSESKDSSSAWGFNFYDGNENWSYLGFSSSRRGFAVHSRRQ